MAERTQNKGLKRVLWGALAAALLVFLGVRVAALVSPGEPASAPGAFRGRGGPAPVSVRVEPAVVGAVEVVAVLSGTLEPQYEVEVFPQRAGRLASVHAEVGQRVDVGDLLAVVEHDELLLQRQQAEASLEVGRATLRRMEVQLQRAKEDFERVEQLYRRGAATQQELERARAQLEEAEIQRDSAKAQLSQAEANLRLVELQLERVRVVAPVGGVVIRRPAVAGSQVGTSTAVAALAAIDPIEVVFHLPEREVGRLRVGQPLTVQVDAFPGRVFTGEVGQLGAAIDARTRSLEVRGRVPNPDLELRPGMFARVEVVLARAEGVLTVAREAVLSGPGGPYVYTVEGGVAVSRPVVLGLEGTERVEVQAGLQEGDVVVVVGQHRLREGRPVVALDAEAEAWVQGGSLPGAAGGRAE